MKTAVANSKNRKELLTNLKPELAIKYRLITTLKLDPKNPRLHSQKQIRQIARSIELFGFSVPILINREMQVVAGHGRIQACKQLGLTEVPTILLEHLSEAQTRAFMIADNRLAENSVWNDHLLAEQFGVLSTLDLDFSVDATGFELGEIEVMLRGPMPDSKAKESLPDAVPEAETKPQVTQSGDVWTLNGGPISRSSAQDNAVHSISVQAQGNAAVLSEPPFIDKIVRLWQKSTRLDAVHQSTGQTFAQREREIANAKQK